MDSEEAERRVTLAVERLVATDGYLFERDLNERTITHRLAVHLEPGFPGWHVDCEFNRDGHDPKRLNLPPRNDIGSDDVHARTVFPDVIIHRRGTDDNLVVIEAKKTTNHEDRTWDDRKLAAFQEELGYPVVVFLLLHTATQRAGATLEFRSGRKVSIGAAP